MQTDRRDRNRIVERRPSVITVDTSVERPSDAFREWDSIIFDMRHRMITMGLDTANGVLQPPEPAEFAQMVANAVAENPAWGIAPQSIPKLARCLHEAFFGLGTLTKYMEMADIEEVYANSYDEVFYVKDGQKVRIDPPPFRDEAELLDMLNRIFAAQNRDLSFGNPSADGSLPDGSRIHASIPPHAVNGAAFAIRRFRPRIFTMDDYLQGGMFTAEFLEEMTEWVQNAYSIVVSGSTASGKTTFLNALGSLLPPTERLVVIEDAHELKIKTEDTLYLESVNVGARNSRNQDNAITIREGIRNALRLRPDRIIVGEIRGHEGFDLLQALNTGHDGSFTTVHSNSALDAISRLESLAMAAGEQGERSVQDMIARGVDIVIQVGRSRNTSARQVIEAWQVMSRTKIDEAVHGPLLKEAARKGDLRVLHGGVIMMLPLFTRDEYDQLVRRYDVVPMISRRTAAKRALAKSAAGPTADAARPAVSTQAPAVAPPMGPPAGAPAPPPEPAGEPAPAAVRAQQEVAAMAARHDQSVEERFAVSSEQMSAMHAAAPHEETETSRRRAPKKPHADELPVEFFPEPERAPEPEPDFALTDINADIAWARLNAPVETQRTATPTASPLAPDAGIGATTPPADESSEFSLQNITEHRQWSTLNSRVADADDGVAELAEAPRETPAADNDDVFQLASTAPEADVALIETSEPVDLTEHVTAAAATADPGVTDAPPEPAEAFTPAWHAPQEASSDLPSESSADLPSESPVDLPAATESGLDDVPYAPPAWALPAEEPSSPAPPAPWAAPADDAEADENPYAATDGQAAPNETPEPASDHDGDDGKKRRFWRS